MKQKTKIVFFLFFIIIQCIGTSLAKSLKEDFIPNTQIHDVLENHGTPSKKESTDFAKDAIELISSLKQKYLAEEEASEDIYESRNIFYKLNEKLINVNQSMLLERSSITLSQKLLLAFSSVYEEINYYSDDIGLDVNENDEKVIDMFNDLLKYVSDSCKWYDFLISLNTALSSYQVRTNYFGALSKVSTFSIDCSMDKDSYSLSQMDVSDLINEIRYLNFDIHYRENSTQKPKIMYDDVKDINIVGVKYQRLCRTWNLAMNPEITTKCDGNRMHVRGEFIKMSDIFINACISAKSVHVYALNTIYIDSDFVHPDKQLILIAPFFVVKPLAMKCVSTDSICYHLPNVDWLKSIIDVEDTKISTLMTQEDLEKLCSQEGRTFQPKCFTDFYNGAELPSLDLVRKYNYSETPRSYGGVLFGFDKDANITNSGYISVKMRWNKTNEISRPIEIKKLYSNQENSLYNLANYSQSDEDIDFSLKTVTFTNEHNDYHTSLRDYKNYLLRSLDENNDHRKKMLLNFYVYLTWATNKMVRKWSNGSAFFDALNMFKELEDLEKIYQLYHQEIDFSQIYFQFTVSLLEKQFSGRCVEDCSEIIIYSRRIAELKIRAILHSATHVVKNIEDHLVDFQNNINWTENIIVTDRLVKINDESAKHIRSKVEEIAFLIQNSIKPEIGEIIQELHSDSEKLQIEVSTSNNNELTSPNSIQSLWKNLLNEKLASTLNYIILISEPFAIEPVIRFSQNRRITPTGRALEHKDQRSDSSFYDSLQTVSQIVENIISNITKQEESVLNKIILKMNGHSSLSDLKKKSEQIMSTNSSNVFELLEKYLLDYSVSDSSAGADEKALVVEILEELRYAELSPDFYLKHEMDEKMKHVVNHSIQLDIMHRYARKTDTFLKHALQTIIEKLKRLSFVEYKSVQDEVHRALKDDLMRLDPLFIEVSTSNKLKLLKDKVSEVIDSYVKVDESMRVFWFLEYILSNLSERGYRPEQDISNTTAEVITESKTMMQLNIWLFYYKNFLRSYKNHVFPFGSARSVNKLPELVSIDLTKMKQSMQNHIDKFLTSLPVEYEGLKENLHQKFFHRSKNGASQPFFVWDNQTYGRDIAKLLSGEIITLKAPLTKDSNLNAVKFKSVQIRLQSLDENQEELQRTLAKFTAKLKHLGSSNYKCRQDCYLIRTNSVEYNVSFANASADYSISSSQQASSDYFLSPYSFWQLELQSTEKSSFSELSQFKYKVDVDLEGDGLYLDNSDLDVCKTDLKKHYEEVDCDK